MIEIEDCPPIDSEEDVYDVEIFDAKELGALIKGYAERRRYARTADLVLDIFRTTGMRWHENTLNIVMRGERLPNLSLLTGFMLVLRIPFRELEEAVREDLRDRFMGPIR